MYHTRSSGAGHRAATETGDLNTAFNVAECANISLYSALARSTVCLVLTKIFLHINLLKILKIHLFLLSGHRVLWNTRKYRPMQ